MERHKVLGAAAAVGLAVTVVSACGGGGGHHSGINLGSPTTGGGNGGGNASSTVTNAVKKLGNEQGLQLVLHLDGSASAFGSKSNLTSAQKQAILNSQVIFAVNTGNGKSLTQAAAANKNSSSAVPSGDFQLALKNNGSNLGTFEVINGKTLYARVDIHQVTTTYGIDAGKAMQFEQELQAASAQVPGLDALNAGQWVSVDLTPLLQLEQQSQGSSTTTGSGLSPASEAQAVTAFLQAFQQNSQITKVGSANGGTKYQAVVKEKQLVNSLGQSLQAVPGLGSRAAGLNNNNIPAGQTVTVDVTVKNGEVSELQLPLNQFDTTHDLNGPLTLSLDVSPSGAISAPQGAKPINVQQIISGLGAGSGSGSSSSSTGA